MRIFVAVIFCCISVAGCGGSGSVLDAAGATVEGISSATSVSTVGATQ